MNPLSIFSSKSLSAKIPLRAGLFALLALIAFFIWFSRKVGIDNARTSGWDRTNLSEMMHKVEILASRQDNRNSIIFLGDSTIMKREKGETLAAKLEKILQSQGITRNNVRIETISHPKLHMAHYYIMAQRLMPTRPVALVVPFNLATLSPDWLEKDGNHNFPYLVALLPWGVFLKDSSLYCRFFNVTFSELLGNQLVFKTHTEDFFFCWRGLRMILRTAIKKAGVFLLSKRYPFGQGTPRDLPNDRASEEKGLRYLDNFYAEEQSWSLVFARKLNQLGIQYNVPVLLYLSPVDQKELDKKEIRSKQEVEKLQCLLAKEKIHVLNLWNLLPHEYFYNPIHFNEKGGWQVAKQLAAELNLLLVRRSSVLP